MAETQEKDCPRFVIVNTIDAPCRKHVAEWVEGIGYCYMARALDPRLKLFDGMTPPKPTAMEDFGFAIVANLAEATFTRNKPECATYEDGKPRHWQDSAWPDHFTLPLVKSVKRIGKEIAENRRYTSAKQRQRDAIHA